MGSASSAGAAVCVGVAVSVEVVVAACVEAAVEVVVEACVETCVGFTTATPLFHINFFPDLMQLYVLS